VPHVTEPWVVGAFAPPDAQTAESKAAIAVSDQLVDEFLAADRYIFGVPMHNFNVPSTFKAYIDQIVRAGRTFAMGPNGFEGLVKNKKALSSPAAAATTRRAHQWPPTIFRSPYLRVIFGFIGLTDLQLSAADS